MRRDHIDSLAGDGPATEGGGILTPVIGYLIDRFGFTAAFAMAGGVLFTITLVCSFWLWGRRY